MLTLQLNNTKVMILRISYICCLCLVTLLNAQPYTNEGDVRSLLQQYIKMNQPDAKRYLSQEKRLELESFNEEYRALSDALGKEEVFYFMMLSDTEMDQPAGIRESYILHVPLRYLKYYEEYSDEEKNVIGAFIWKYKQLGFLEIEHLRKVNYPPVRAYLNEELAKEGGPGTGRGYKIYKIVNELKDLDEAEGPTLVTPAASKIVEQSLVSETEVKEPALVKLNEEAPEESSQWLLWLVGALVVVGGLALVVRRERK